MLAASSARCRNRPGTRAIAAPARSPLERAAVDDDVGARDGVIPLDVALLHRDPARPTSPRRARRRAIPLEPHVVRRVDLNADVVVVARHAVEGTRPRPRRFPPVRVSGSRRGGGAPGPALEPRLPPGDERVRPRCADASSEPVSVPELVGTDDLCAGDQEASVDLPAPPCPPIPTNVNPRAGDAAATSSRTGATSTCHASSVPEPCGRACELTNLARGLSVTDLWRPR